MEQAELDLFESEYQEHYLEGETKPPEIGRPYLLHNEQAKAGILLIHGLMAAPAEVRQLADYLYEQGYTVYAPRLAGHGTSAVDLQSRVHAEWRASVERGAEILRQLHDRVVVAGFSTGAGLALQQAQLGDYDALVAISPPLKFTSLQANNVGLAVALGRLIRHPKLQFATNHADNPEINYLRCPLRALHQVRLLMRELKPELIKIPSLIMQAPRDPKVDGTQARKLFEKLDVEQKRYVEIDFHLHGIVRGEITKESFPPIAQFLAAIV